MPSGLALSNFQCASLQYTPQPALLPFALKNKIRYAPIAVGLAFGEMMGRDKKFEIRAQCSSFNTAFLSIHE